MPARSPRRSAVPTAPASKPSTARRAAATKAQRVALASAPAGVVGKVSAKGDAMSKGRRGTAPAPVAAATSAMALYEQVKDFIARKIQEGAWRAGDRLPSESELVTQFGISRMTVNRALRELSEQGRIVRVAGVGSFVAEEKPQSTLLQIANLASEIRQRGHDYRCDVLAVERVSASLEVAAALDLRTGESVFHSLCIHREDGLPVQLEDRYVNPRQVPQFAAGLHAAAAFRVPGAQRSVRPSRACGRCCHAHRRAGSAAGDAGHRTLSAAHAAYLVAWHSHHGGALPAPGIALSAGQPFSGGWEPGSGLNRPTKPHQVSPPFQTPFFR